jgi:hypothetical protein
MLIFSGVWGKLIQMSDEQTMKMIMIATISNLYPFSIAWWGVL